MIDKIKGMDEYRNECWIPPVEKAWWDYFTAIFSALRPLTGLKPLLGFESRGITPGAGLTGFQTLTASPFGGGGGASLLGAQSAENAARVTNPRKQKTGICRYGRAKHE
ncbi:MAG: hypothetical protein LBR10_00415 [Prevotellaceae bacterium]|nr:hypothetical protein [Prevotellaceae bacterium]